MIVPPPRASVEFALLKFADLLTQVRFARFALFALGTAGTFV
jgi:hypothetical protein